MCDIMFIIIFDVYIHQMYKFKYREIGERCLTNELIILLKNIQTCILCFRPLVYK